MSAQEIKTDASAPLSANKFTRHGYTFVGWSVSKDGGISFADGDIYIMGTKNEYELYAVWMPNLNYVYFNGNGADGGCMDPIQIRTGETSLLPESEFVKTGYTFIGWTTEAGGGVIYKNGAEYTMGEQSAYTLYAVWDANRYTITLVMSDPVNHTQHTDIAEVIYDDTYKLIVPDIVGYDFIGWYDSLEQTSVAYTDEQGNSLTSWTNLDVSVLYAKYAPRLNVIIFNGNGIEGSMPNITGYSDSNVRLPANTFVADGYEFVGWSETSNGELLYYDRDLFNMGRNSSYILYALWRPVVGESDLSGYTPIYDIEDLNAVRNNLTGKYYLANDLDLNGVEWEPIGTENQPFTGIFDGRGHAVLNMNRVNTATLSYDDQAIGINTSSGRPEAYHYVIASYGSGLFGYNSGSILNLNLIGSDIEVQCSIQKNDSKDKNRKSISYYVGGISAYSTGKIANCYSDGKISLALNVYNVRYGGGIVGRVGSGYEIVDCSADMTIKSGYTGRLDLISGSFADISGTEIVSSPLENINMIKYATSSGNYVSQCNGAFGREFIAGCGKTCRLLVRRVGFYRGRRNGLRSRR